MTTYKYSRKQLAIHFDKMVSALCQMESMPVNIKVAINTFLGSFIPMMYATKEQRECEHIFCSTAKNGDVTCDDCHKLLQNIDNPHPTKPSTKKKIEPIDITKESIEREKELAVAGGIGFAVISQRDNVIEDKINELIEVINKIQR